MFKERRKILNSSQKEENSYEKNVLIKGILVLVVIAVFALQLV